MIRDAARLTELFGGPDAAWIRARLRDVYERRGTLPSRIARRDATPAERELVDRLFGRAATSREVSVPVGRLEDILRQAEICEDLVEALVALDGPLRDRRAEAAARAQSWDAAHAAWATRATGRLWLEAWVDDLRTTGLLKRMSRGEAARARSLVDDALIVIDRFPLPGTCLPELAAAAYGDAHALDKDRPLGHLAVRAAARHAGLSDWQSAEGRRECWAAVGVICDELSAPVLTLNLGASGDGLNDRVLELHRDAGEACSLSLRQLVRRPARLDHLRDRDVFVCENPSVVAVAAERLGPRSAPLVCTSGQARAATRLLLRSLAEAGARLRVQADLDIDGLHIAAKSLELLRATPWRMSAVDYATAAAGPPLRRADVPTTPWDPELRAAMRARGVGVHEEVLLPVLLRDLSAGEPG